MATANSTGKTGKTPRRHQPSVQDIHRAAGAVIKALKKKDLTPTASERPASAEQVEMAADRIGYAQYLLRILHEIGLQAEALEQMDDVVSLQEILLPQVGIALGLALGDLGQKINTRWEPELPDALLPRAAEEVAP